MLMMESLMTEAVNKINGYEIKSISKKIQE